LYLHNELKALGASRQEVSVLRHGGNECLVALGVRREVGHVSKKPLHHVNVTTLVGGQQRSDPTVINSLEEGGKEKGGRGRRKRG
jgi:hypothetical protein